MGKLIDIPTNSKWQTADGEELELILKDNHTLELNEEANKTLSKMIGLDVAESELEFSAFDEESRAEYLTMHNEYGFKYYDYLRIYHKSEWSINVTCYTPRCFETENGPIVYFYINICPKE